MSSDDQVSLGFVRQRRSLVAVSVILFFYYSTGARVGPSLSFLGVPVTLEKPEQVTAAIWLAWVYFLVRYYQYMRDLGAKGFRRTYHEAIERHVHRNAVRRMEQQFATDNPEYSRIRFEPERIMTVIATPSFWELEVVGAYAFRTPTGLGHQRSGEGLDHVFEPVLRVARARAVLHVFANTRLVTEYVLPFVVAALPLVFPAASFAERWLTSGCS